MNYRNWARYSAVLGSCVALAIGCSDSEDRKASCDTNEGGSAGASSSGASGSSTAGKMNGPGDGGSSGSNSGDAGSPSVEGGSAGTGGSAPHEAGAPAQGGAGGEPAIVEEGGAAGATGETGEGGAGGDAPVLPTNLVLNSGFEVDASSWIVNGAGAVTTSEAQAHSGTKSGLLTGRMNAYEGPAYDLTGIVMPLTDYDVEAYMRIGAGTKGSQITLKYTCEGAGTTYVGVANADLSDAEWTKVSGTFQIPDCNATGVNVYFEAFDATVDIYIDDVWVTLAQ